MARFEEHGDVAQLGERSVRNAEVVGSIPIVSTMNFKKARCSLGLLSYSITSGADVMADIQMRFGKDMLVLSTGFERAFAQQGFDLKTEEAYVDLCEPELVEQAYQMEQMIGTPVLCTPTECITNARLSHEKFEGQGAEVAQVAWDLVDARTPQHSLAVIGPTGLPLDESSATSLKASRKQYQDAVAELIAHPFDGIYFAGFTSGYDAQCALVAARAIYDGPVFLSFEITDEGVLPSGSHTLEEAVRLADEYGASAIGIVSGARLENLETYVGILREATDKPLLVEIVVRELIERALNPSADNPYYAPASMMEAAETLHARGVQFVRAVGMASPAYTGALVATLSGLDVVVEEGSDG